MVYIGYRPLRSRQASSTQHNTKQRHNQPSALIVLPLSSVGNFKFSQRADSKIPRLIGRCGNQTLIGEILLRGPKQQARSPVWRRASNPEKGAVPDQPLLFHPKRNIPLWLFVSILSYWVLKRRMNTLTPPPQARLSKRGSWTPSIRRLLQRYPPAIIDDTPPDETPPIIEENVRVTTATREPSALSSFDRRFPDGYRVADPSIPLFPDEVPFGSEKLFSPVHKPICRTVLPPPLPHLTGPVFCSCLVFD